LIARLRDVGQRRRLLVVRSNAQREALAEAAAPVVRRLRAVDRALSALRAHPLLAGSALGALTFAGRRRLVGWAARAAAAYALLRRI
jgi:hypothetical protein